jgi:hypothetical protein
MQQQVNTPRSWYHAGLICGSNRSSNL